MIRLQNKVPEVYVNESRDFQLLLRLYDYVFNGTRFYSKSMENLLCPAFVNDRMLILLASYVGFFPTIEIDNALLRRIIGAFPYIIKNKGNMTGIRLAVATVLKAENSNAKYEVINNKKDYIIEIYTEVELYNKNALIEVLKYVLPIGYDYRISTFTSLEGNLTTSSLGINNKVSYITAPEISVSQIIGDDRVMDSDNNINQFDFTSLPSYNTLGSINNLGIIGTNNFSSDNEYREDRLYNNRDTIDERINISNENIGEN